MAKVQVSVVHDNAGRILSVSQFGNGVQATVLGGEGESVLATSADDKAVSELIHTHEVDVERKRLIDVSKRISGDPSSAVEDRDALSSMLNSRD